MIGASVLQEIKPKGLARVIDSADAAGVDVSAWKDSGNPSNPKYCYEWAFPGTIDRPTLLFLWHEECQVDEEGVFQSGTVRNLILALEAKGVPTAARARRFDQALQTAWHLKADIRVALVDCIDGGVAEKLSGSDTMRATARQLDPQPWRLISYDFMSGEYLIRRGLQASVLKDVESLQSMRPEHCPETMGDGIRNIDILLEDLAQIAQDESLDATDRDAMVKARVGQGYFRNLLLTRWGAACAVTGVSCLSVLRASHIKPWRLASSRERLDPNNGLLLSANLDSLFDSRLISFYEDGAMWISQRLTEECRSRLSIPAALRLPLGDKEREFLREHLDGCKILDAF
ncbi:HNH endonuclease [Stenotrophomonas maltophilia]|uniref:HNH endonuclease n=1 Tax=Stenotrophomonas maltophilia TaxID=40324 RepID=UPI002893D352|nr:HNH endonuclease signature motif containing protein [Stenotrophomonas maltophilia]MDT3488358.1 HNH endonuclease signature motif containing protein [Stenotrophomonas maltophilia]